jgi:hypothetical protein
MGKKMLSRNEENREINGSHSCQNVGNNILRKAKNVFRHVYRSEHHSVRLHGTTRQQLDRFSWNLILRFFLKLRQTYIYHYIPTSIRRHFCYNLCTFMIVSLRIHFRIKNTLFVSNKIFRNSWRLWDHNHHQVYRSGWAMAYSSKCRPQSIDKFWYFLQCFRWEMWYIRSRALIGHRTYIVPFVLQGMADQHAALGFHAALGHRSVFSIFI